MFRKLLLTLVAAIQLALAGAVAAQQTPAVKNNESHDDLRVTTEEVRIPFAAFDEYGRFEPAVELEDLLVREDGVAQQLRSLYRIPASVLLLLDTGDGQNPAKSVRLTRSVASTFVSHLRADDSIALMQVGDRVELLRDWTVGRAEILKALNQKLFPDKRTALARGITAAVGLLSTQPAGNRHLILVTEGIETVAGEAEYASALKELIAANVTVHVLSYTALGRHTPGPRVTRQRVDSNLPEELLMSLPRYRKNGRQDMVEQLKRKGGTIISLERLFKRDGDYREARDRSELELTVVAEETGGAMWLPESAKSMQEQAAEAAREVDAQYVLTYKPQRPLASSAPGEFRSVDVISRRAGLHVRSRRGYVSASIR